MHAAHERAADAFFLTRLRSLKKALPDNLAGQSSAVFICSLTAAALVRHVLLTLGMRVCWR